MGKRKKNLKTIVVHQTPPAPFLHFIKSIPSILSGNVEGLFIMLAVSHVFFFLVFLGSVASFNTASNRPFGDPAAAEEKARMEKVIAAKGTPVSLPATAVYAAFTAIVWGIMFWKRKEMAPRLFRFLPLVLAPGTIMVAYLIFTHLRP